MLRTRQLEAPPRAVGDPERGQQRQCKPQRIEIRHEKDRGGQSMRRYGTSRALTFCYRSVCCR